MKWRVYWGDGETWSGDPFNPPQRFDCQVVAFERDTEKGFALAHGKDYYVWRGDQWFGVDTGGLWDYLLTYSGPQSVLHGRTMPRTDDFWAIVGRAGREGLGE